METNNETRACYGSGLAGLNGWALSNHFGYWKDREAALRKELDESEVGSIRHIVTGVFHRNAQWQVRILTEQQNAEAWSNWGFYRQRAKTLAAPFLPNTTIRDAEDNAPRHE